MNLDLFPPFESREAYDPASERFRELHLYNGPRCNRSCDFCTVAGDAGGWYEPFSERVLASALRWVAPGGNLKIYGGEPTLDLPNLLWAMRWLRGGGYSGWFTIFSNGVLAERVIALLEADRQTEVVLNYSILTGQGAPPLPEAALRQLAQYAGRRPGVLFRSHPDLLPVLKGAEFLLNAKARRYDPLRGCPGTRRKREGLNAHCRLSVPQFEGACPLCHPVLTTRGELRACPFAVEVAGKHYDLGDCSLSASEASRGYAGFRDWIRGALEPAARRRGEHPCRTCTGWGPGSAFDIHCSDRTGGR